MIDYEKSAELNGMGVEELKSWFERFQKSNKVVVKICDECGEISNVSFDTYRPLCRLCSLRTPEARESARMKTLEQMSDPEARNKISKSLKQYHKEHLEAGKAISKRQIERCKDPNIRKEMLERRIQYYIDNPEAGIEHGKIMAQFYKDNPGVALSQSKQMIEYYSNQDNRDDHSDRLKKYNKDPKVKRLRSEVLKRYHIDHPEVAKYMSARMQGIPYEEWDGFSEGDWRDWNEAIYVNEPFSGCHRHHITETIVVCIPGELHYHIRHNLKTGENMGKINALAIQFINGGL